jgi:hypothetical protein
VGVALTGRIRTPLPAAAVRRGHTLLAG